MGSTRVASYAYPHCVQEQVDSDDVVRDADDPDAEAAVPSVAPAQPAAVPRVAPAQPEPGSVTPVVAQPVRQKIPRHTRDATQAPRVP